jgi:peptide/nickel transport system permease protein
MLSFLLRRVAQMVPLLVLVSLVVFALIHAAPGGPLALYLDNPNVRPQDIERLRRQMGLDRPLVEQYLAWAWAFVRGEWGYSYADGRPVMDRLLERVPATLQLVGVSSLLAVVLSLVAGVVSAARRGVDRAVTAGAIAGISLPVFWLGLVLQLVFANQLGWFPSAGRSSFAGGGLADRLAHLVLPVIVLAAAYAAGWSRYLRSSMREALAQSFINVARARGVSEGRLVSRHALRYALLPFATVVLLDASLMMSGAVVTESVFAWPGAGSLFTESLAKRDYTVLMAFLMCGAITVALLSLVSDVVVRALDPRMRDAA